MRRADLAELVLLTVASALLNILCCGFLMIYISVVPFPITALVAMVGNWLLFTLARQVTGAPGRFAPMIAAALVILVAMVPGPNNSESFIWGLPMMLMVMLGLALPVFVTTLRTHQPVLRQPVQ